MDDLGSIPTSGLGPFFLATNFKPGLGSTETPIELISGGNAGAA